MGGVRKRMKDCMKNQWKEKRETFSFQENACSSYSHSSFTLRNKFLNPFVIGMRSFFSLNRNGLFSL